MIINLQGRKAHVRVIIHQEPCLLLEAMELAYSYVNKAPLEQLVASGEFAIPEKDVLHIRDTVCRALDPKDDMVRFFFQRIVVDRDPPASGIGQTAGIAQCAKPVYGCYIQLRAIPSLAGEIIDTHRRGTATVAGALGGAG